MIKQKTLLNTLIVDKCRLNVDNKIFIILMMLNCLSKSGQTSVLSLKRTEYRSNGLSCARKQFFEKLQLFT